VAIGKKDSYLVLYPHSGGKVKLHDAAASRTMVSSGWTFNAFGYITVERTYDGDDVKEGYRIVLPDGTSSSLIQQTAERRLDDDTYSTHYKIENNYYYDVTRYRTVDYKIDEGILAGKEYGTAWNEHHWFVTDPEGTEYYFDNTIYSIRSFISDNPDALRPPYGPVVQYVKTFKKSDLTKIVPYGNENLAIHIEYKNVKVAITANDAARKYAALLSMCYDLN